MLGDITVSKSKNNIVGKSGEKITNNNGTQLIGHCEAYSLGIMNRFFEHKSIHEFTWTQPTPLLKTITDYVILKQESSILTNDVRVYRGAKCGLYHFPFRAVLYFSYLTKKRHAETAICKIIQPQL